MQPLPRRLYAPSSLRPVVSTPRRLCAPSSLLLRATLLALLSLLLRLSPASAQVPSYGPADFSSSTGTYDPGGGPPQGPPVQPFSSNGGVPGYGGIAPGGGQHTLYASGGIIATFPYTGPMPLPQSVIVVQSCVAGWLSMSYGTPVIGTCDNGLGGPKNSYGPAPGPSGTTASGVMGLDSSGNPLMVYSVVAGASPLVLPTVTVKANVAGDAMSGQLRASVSYTSAVSPVTISLGGATQDSSGNYNILVGQGCTASLSGVPSSCTVSNYQWSVSDAGLTFQAWRGTTLPTPPAPANANASYYVSGAGSLNNSTAHWYWDDNATTATVTCTATVTPPNGQGSAFSITVTQSVNIVLPTTAESPTVGRVQINSHGPSVYGTNPALYAGGTSAIQPYGIIFTTQVQTPALFVSSSSGL